MDDFSFLLVIIPNFLCNQPFLLLCNSLSADRFIATLNVVCPAVRLSIRCL